MNETQAADLKASFDRDGFVILRKFVPIEQVSEICRRAVDATKDQPRRAMYNNVTKGLERLDSYFGELLEHGPQVPVLEMLMGKMPIPTTASFFTKTVNDEEVHPHSDAIEGGVIWIALDESNEQNGCLYFLKGSHRRQTEFAYLRANEPNDLSGHPDVFAAVMSPGDVAFFRPTTVHWSGKNYDGSARRGFNCFYTGNLMRKGYPAQTESG